MAAELGSDAGPPAPGAERARVETLGQLENGLRQAGDWYLWGPYVSERQWGTVREDYSAHGTAWEYLPHDDARSRAYRWGEDGLAGFCDVEQRLCLGLALWNGRDPILKERIFGLTGNQGNHGEDPKEYWWYLDATPSHSWNRWRYHYPQSEFPYARLVDENAARTKLDPEFELLDTGVFDDDRYWIVEAHYAKGDPFDVLLTVQVTNAGPEADTLHVLPTAWYRNTWAWEVDADAPVLRAGADEPQIETEHPFLGTLEIVADDGPGGEAPELLFCDNETNDERLFGTGGRSPYPKDGINDHVVSGRRPSTRKGRARRRRSTTASPSRRARPSSYVSACVRPVTTASPWADFDDVVAARRGEADEFYEELTPPACSDDEANVMRQAFAGMLWGKQLYYYDVKRWLAGDPTQPTPPESRHAGRNRHWITFEAFDIMSMPDPWEYPWFAAWDSAFHCIALAHVDPAFAKYQLTLLCREWFQHPNGALPAYEWAFDDVNPPVQAWAALQVFAIDGGRDVAFLSRIFDKLLVNFTWWVNRLDADGSNVFEGGFLGLDNIGPIDRSHLPSGYMLEQADATGWMAAYALTMAAIAAVLNRTMRPTTDLIVKFLEHFSLISEAIEEQGLWDEEDGFYYDQLRRPDGSVVPVKVRSMVGVLPLTAFAVVDDAAVDRARAMGKHFARLLERHDERLRRPDETVADERPAPSSASSASIICCASSRGCSTRTRSSRRTGCARCRAGISSTRSASTWAGTRRRSTTSRPSRRRRCSAATPTGAGRSGSPSTTSSSTPCSATPGTSATTSSSSIRRAPASAGRSRRSARTCAAGSSRSSSSARTAAGLATAGSTSSRTILPGRTTSSSTSTSTATTAPGSERATRPAGRGSSPT